MAPVLAPVTDRRVTRRAAFDRVADLYDRIRPGYPAALFDDLADIAGLRPGATVLEIGCGTGQASIAVAERGWHLLAVDIGTRMAELAAKRLAGYSDARVVVADFDRWMPDETGFDVVFSATAFHWLDPATRFARTADLLAPGGVLATVATHHIVGGTEDFFVDVQACYRRFDPTTTPADGIRLLAAQVPFDTALGDNYQRPVFRRYEWSAEYDTADYLDLLRTYSPTLAMSQPAGEGLLRSIGQLIDGRYGGRITKRYLTELRVARKA
ncbi:MAG TPA: class I SAM-dependent methyltransferase [Pseudonocardiaceae bacterium]